MRIGVKVKLVNDHLLSVIHANGYKSVYEFSNKNGFYPTTIGKYVNLQDFPTKPEICGRLEKALKTPIDMLFPPDLIKSIEERKKYKKKMSPFYFTKEVEHLSIEQVPMNQLSYETDNTLEIRECLEAAMGTLNEREEDLLRFRYGFDGDPKTLDETAEKFFVSRERVRQIEAKALRKLRHPQRTKIITG